MSISVIVRVRDEADALDLCLGLLRAQSDHGESVELIVVDNDSQDGSAAVARRHGAQVVRISRERFTFGRALNLGASVAQGTVLVAVSAHAFIDAPDWLNRVEHWFEDETVACVSGERHWPDGSPLLGPIRYGARMALGYPRWGYSNAAGAFRSQLWRERHFREDLSGAEDKEWARYWALERGRVTVLDPGLAVRHDHTHDPLGDIYARARREASAFRRFLGSADAPRRPLLAEWFWDTRFYTNPWRARFSHRRLARLLGDHVGAFEENIRRET